MPLDLKSLVPPSWRTALADAMNAPSFTGLEAFLRREREQSTVFPSDDDIFHALEVTSLQQVRVVILGQDPYHDDGQAHGLAFSVKPGMKPPPSLQNIFKELSSDVGAPHPGHGHLLHWARQGVLLLNAVLTVRAHEAGSHQKRGWEPFTDAVIRAVVEKPDPAVFVLWGAQAQKKRKLVEGTHHAILESAHPSPLSAHNGFFGSRPFSRVNAMLRERGYAEIEWALPPL